MLSAFGVHVTIYQIALVGTVLLAALAQALMRIGARGRKRVLHSFLNPWTITAQACFGIDMVMMIFAMRAIPFRTVMAVSSLVYIATPLAARFIAKDPLTARMMVGACIIVVGIVTFFL
ncbi:hypothetical protein EHM69_07495 [candidate division KSB1 bacterium]|nr:MAG: hypothetical protein EHM69_07495 [candidate division KSB1 bacterium]